MPQTRLPHSPELRRQMIELARTGRDQADDAGLAGAEREELARLRREVRQLRLERELGHELILSQPDPDWSELDGGEEVVVALVVSGCDGAEVLELDEEALDQVAVSVEEGAEAEAALAVRHRSDAG